MTADALMKTALSALVGAGIGWGANALTLSGRVDALEQGQSRIEGHLLTIINAKGINPAVASAARPAESKP